MKPAEIESEKLGLLIEELGTRMLARPCRESQAAFDQMSLIDDSAVVAWYVKAVKSDRSTWKYKGLDRLCYFEGDDALEGITIGLGTKGEDIGNATTSKVAESSAVNIRHKALNALARSPHSSATKVRLLSTLHESPSPRIRLVVVQAAARIATPESLALVKSQLDDKDPTVRSEAERLLNDIQRNDRSDRP
jgi:hypothetical protein